MARGFVGPIASFGAPANGARQVQLTDRDAEPGCEDGWASLPSAAFPGKIKVWATCTGTYGEDLRQMLRIVESFWGPMTEFMGIEPLPDEGTAAAEARS